MEWQHFKRNIYDVDSDVTIANIMKHDLFKRAASKLDIRHVATY